MFKPVKTLIEVHQHIFILFSFYRNFNWNRCPSGHYLSGLYRSDGERATLNDIEYGWCCKPNGAPSYLKMCYDEDVSSSFHWDKKGMVLCSRSGYYITALYRSTCPHLHCITKFRCCEFQVTEGWYM